MKRAVSATAHGFNRVLHAFGSESALADFFGHPFSHPLSESYFSQVPLRFGDYVAKLAVVPVAPAQLGLVDWRLEPQADEDGFGHAAVTFFREHEAVFEVKAQLWVDADKQPIEDASIDWPVSISPYRTIATLRLPVQNAGSPERRRFFDEVMNFSLAHALATHRPPGSVMRARLRVYSALSAFRHTETATPAQELASLDAIPA